MERIKRMFTLRYKRKLTTVNKRAIILIFWLEVILFPINVMVVESFRVLQGHLEHGVYQLLFTIASSYSIIALVIKRLKVRMIERFLVISVIILIPVTLTGDVSIIIYIDELVLTLMWILITQVDMFLFDRYLKHVVNVREYNSTKTGLIGFLSLVFGLLLAWILKTYELSLDDHLLFIKINIIYNLLLILITVFGHWYWIVGKNKSDSDVNKDTVIVTVEILGKTDHIPAWTTMTDRIYYCLYIRISIGDDIKYYRVKDILQKKYIDTLSKDDILSLDYEPIDKIEFTLNHYHDFIKKM